MPQTLLTFTSRATTFFGDATLPFSPGLNVFIGGSGSGKTTLFYLIRYALGHAIPDDYAKEFAERVKWAIGAGSVTVEARTQHGVVYTFSRSWGEPPKVRNAAGERVDAALVGELFAIDAFAAKEIEQLATKPVEVLRLLQRFAPEDTRRIAASLAEVERRFVLAGAEIDRLDADIAHFAANEGELPVVLEALTALAPEGATPSSALARVEARRPARGREQSAMKTLEAEVANIGRAVDLLAVESKRRLAGAIEGELERADEPVGPIFRRAHESAQRVAGTIEDAAGKIRAELARATEAIAREARALAAVHDEEDEAYKTLVVQKDSDRGRATQRETLHRRRDELADAARQAADRRRERDRKQAEYDALQTERAGLIDQGFAVLDRIAGEVTAAAGGEVKVTMTRHALTEPYGDFLTALLEGSGTSKDFLALLADRLHPSDLYAAVAADDVGPIVEVDTLKGNRDLRARKLVQAIRATGRAREILTAPILDRPNLFLKVRGNLEPAEKGSSGERCTSILPILLLRQLLPFVVDQIEDHLDNRFIYQVLVQALLASKENRQFLFASHNPNIPVLGDAERVIELQVAGGQARVAHSGNVEEMRERIEAVLEGGREAFLKRGERYGHLPKTEPRP